MMFNTIDDGPAICEIRSVIRFSDTWSYGAYHLADTAQVQRDHFHKQNHMHRFLDQKRSHIGYISHPKSRPLMPLHAVQHWKSCEVPFKTRHGDCLVMM